MMMTAVVMVVREDGVDLGGCSETRVHGQTNEPRFLHTDRFVRT